MKAAVHHEYGPPDEVVRLADVAVPRIGDDEVLLSVRAAGVNWADASMTTGVPYVMRLGYGLRRPRKGVRGTDVAGTVEAIGPDVTAFGPGDEVLGWCTGAFAEFTVVNEHHLVAKPADLTFEQAAGMPMAGCAALQALRDIAKVRPGQRVLINGASGGIGSFAVQIAEAFGAEVTGVCSTANLDLVRSLGADEVIDYTECDISQGPARYDVMLDMADTLGLRQRRRILNRHGTLIPNSGEGGRWFGSLGRIIGAWVMSPFVSQKLRPFLSMATVHDLQELVDLVAAGSLTPVVGHVYPLDRAGAAIARAGSGHARGKVVISLDPPARG